MTKEDEITITVINGLLDLIDNSDFTSGVRLTLLRNCLVELKRTFHEMLDKTHEEQKPEEKEISGNISVHVYFPSLKAKTAVKIPIVDGIVTIDGRNMEDLLMLVREGYTKEEDLKRKLIDDLNQLITNSFNSGSISH